jgi:uncharacterized membrane protein
MKMIKNEKLIAIYELVKKKIIQLHAYFSSEEGLKVLSQLPLFVSWVPVLIYNFDNKSILRSCFHGFSLSLFFLFGLFLSYFLSFFPYIGGLLANLVHSLSILVYLSVCVFLVYSEVKHKKVELGVLEKVSSELEKLLV